MAEALFLDFDGLVVDTETMDFESWQSVYRDYGVEIPRKYFRGISHRSTAVSTRCRRP